MPIIDIFLKLDGIAGDSRDVKHKGELELESYGFGASNTGLPGGGGGGGAGSGKVEMEDFRFTTRVGRASPELFVACATGRHIATAILVVRHAGGQQQEFLKVTLTDVVVTAYRTAGSEPDVGPLDQVALGFGRIELEFRPQKADGSLGAPIKSGWDAKKNKEV